MYSGPGFSRDEISYAQIWQQCFRLTHMFLFDLEGCNRTSLAILNFNPNLHVLVFFQHYIVSRMALTQSPISPAAPSAGRSLLACALAKICRYPEACGDHFSTLPSSDEQTPALRHARKTRRVAMDQRKRNYFRNKQLDAELLPPWQ